MAGTLSAALSRVVRTPVTLTCAGRTDAGVHALDQVVHVDVPADRSAELEPAALVKSCNSQIGPAHRGPVGRDRPRGVRRPPLGHGPPLPLPGGQRPGAGPAAGRPDLARGRPARPPGHGQRRRRPARRARLPRPSAGGCRARRPSDPIPRRVLDARWTRLDGRPAGARTAGTSELDAGDRSTGAWLAPVVGDLLAFEIEANAFCHQMVRSLVGTLVDVGRGRKRPSDILHILRSADRSQASQPAPPAGPDPHGGPLLRPTRRRPSRPAPTATRWRSDRGLPTRPLPT